MVDRALTRQRIVAQGLATRPFACAAAVVSAFGPMQGQDLPGVISSLALRLTPTPGADPVAAVTEAFDRGEIVRGYPMRGTVFAVSSADLRWMTELCAGPAVRAQVNRRAQLGLDDAQVKRAREVFEATLGEQPRGLPRAELMAHWDAAGLATAGGRGYHLLTHLIATGVAVYGPWNGKDMNVVAAETWLPPGSSLAERFDGDETAAIAEMLRRYLLTRGPATLRDFAWWTKLPLGRIRTAAPLATAECESGDDNAGETRHWRPGLLDEVAAATSAADAVHLLPGFDELVLGYPDRLTLLGPDHHARLVPGNNGVFQKGVLHRSAMVGLWKRAGRPGKRALEITAFDTLPQRAERLAAKAFEEFPHVGE